MPAIPLDRWEVYFDLRDEGHGVGDAAKRAGIDRSAAYRFERGDTNCAGIRAANELNRRVVGDRIIPDTLTGDAASALDNFALFRLRYMGRTSTPWQEKAANEVAALLDTDQREYVVINMPPGSGKSTLFTHDIACWLIARRRNIRILIGSRTERQARQYVGRIKRTLERDTPLVNDPDAVAAGRVHNAAATLPGDFGAFKPEGRSDLWRHDALVVQQPGGQATDDKEPTVSAYGQDSGFLGGRYDVVLWDDLVDSRNTRTDESAARSREWYSTEAETRLEPGGVFILQGQRIAADDLYRYALDLENADGGKKYTHIVYPAHHDELCEGNHGPDAKPWPEGCLLDPYRLPHHELERVRKNEPRTYNLMYQQNDDFVIGGLLDPAWLTGGPDADGVWTPGCYDDNRSIRNAPNHVLPGAYSFITVDPSPTEYWGIHWWLYDEDSSSLILMDTKRTRLTPEQFLYRDIETGRYSGLIHEWWEAALVRDHPLHTVVVEINAAQRWLLSQPHIQKWTQTTGVTFTTHTTNRNKHDSDYGLESVGAWFKHGRIRIPNAMPADRLTVHPLIDEALKYPNHKTTDMLMSLWFATLHANTGYARRDKNGPTMTAWAPTARRGLR